jgi:hypothetical protein
MLGKLAILALLFYAACPKDASEAARTNTENCSKASETKSNEPTEKLSKEEIAHQISDLEEVIKVGEQDVDRHRRLAEDLIWEAALSDNAREAAMTYIDMLRVLHNVKARLYQLKKALMQYAA